MKSLLVALIVHLMSNPASPTLGAVPVYVVPAKPFGAGGEALTLTTSQGFGDLERRKWQSVMTMVGAPQIGAELCYRAAYKDFRSGVAAMKPVERDDFLVKNGGHQMLARIAVRWCNVSLRKLDVLPFGHPEFAQAERGVRETAYADDAAFLKRCSGEVCGRAAESFAAATVGIPLEAEK